MINLLLDSKGEDRILLLSGGPKSHLAKKNLFAKGMKKRVVITQPGINPQKTHSPLLGETILDTQKIPFSASLQNRDSDGWSVTKLIQSKSLDALLKALIPFTPKGSVWAGALSYDLVQWTQPIRLQHPPQEGEILAVLWLVENWIECEFDAPELPLPVRINGEKSSHNLSLIHI